jgi:hypothetical protein
LLFRGEQFWDAMVVSLMDNPNEGFHLQLCFIYMILRELLHGKYITFKVFGEEMKPNVLYTEIIKSPAARVTLSSILSLYL